MASICRLLHHWKLYGQSDKISSETKNANWKNIRLCGHRIFAEVEHMQQSRRRDIVMQWTKKFSRHSSSVKALYPVELRPPSNISGTNTFDRFMRFSEASISRLINTKFKNEKLIADQTDQRIDRPVVLNVGRLFRLSLLSAVKPIDIDIYLNLWSIPAASR